MENNVKYKRVEYWNERYVDEEHFEWFGQFAMFKQVLNECVPRHHRILMLGCGNSRMSEDMYADGYERIVNIDYSAVCIEKMRLKCGERMAAMSWLVMDINELTFEDASFDCVLEKGTLDALLVDERDPWRLSDANSVKLDKILQRVSSLLKDGGVFVSITFAQPHFRKPIYAQNSYNWSIRQYTIGDTFHYFVYVMTKGEPLDERDKYFRCRQPQAAVQTSVPTVELSVNENYLLDIRLDE